MAIAQADFIELWRIAQQKGEVFHRETDFEIEDSLPPTLGEGSERLIKLRGGLTIQIRNAELRQTLRLEQQHDPEFPLTAKFYLSGSSRVQTQGAIDIQADYTETAGCNYLYYLPNLTEVEEWPSDELLHVVMIYASADYFRSFSMSETPLAPPLRRLLDGDETQRFHQSLGQTTPAMNQVLQQILQAPYQGMMQYLYLESKALELLALQFVRLDAESPVPKPFTLKPNDLERVQYAREILVQRACNPPSLIELARQAGLNECILKQGFRHLFGTTVFGYLRDYRMQQAQRLLRSPHATVAQVAAQVGYRNPEAFSTAFRRKFSVSPKAYQLRQCG